MKKLTFKKVDTITENTRKATIKNNVVGYRKVIKSDNIVIFYRGNIGIVITILPDDFTFEKFNYSQEEYLEFTYDDVRKFFDFESI